MYEDPILHRIIELMNAHGPSALRGRWTVGDSLNIPKGLLPHAFIAYESENIYDIAQGELRNNAIVVISVVVDMTNELKVPTNRSDSHEQVIGLMAGKDPNTFLLKPDSVIGTLRKYQDLDKDRNIWIEVGSESSVEYGVGIEKRGPGITTAEGILRFQITHEQLIPGLAQ